MTQATDTHRTTIELDVDALEQARELLGTTTIKDTVTEALREVVRLAKLKKAADLVRGGGLRELNIVHTDDLPQLRRDRS